MRSLSSFTATAPDLDDAGLVRVMLELSTGLSHLGETRITVGRFGHDVFDGAPDREALDDVLFSAAPAEPPAGSLRTLDQVGLLVGVEHERCTITVTRGIGWPAASSLTVTPTGFIYLENLRAVADGALGAATAEVNSATQQNRHDRETKRQLQIQAQNELTSREKQLSDTGPVLVRRMYECVAWCHKLGLVRPWVSVAAQGDATTTQLADEVAALRQTIYSQERSAVDRAKALDDEYANRSTSMRVEHAERSERLLAEFEERARRQSAEIEAREAAVQHKVEEVKGREERLNLNGEKAERRRLRGEIHQAAKALAENPDLSKDAKDAFARVVTASRWTAMASAITLIVAVIVPFWLSQVFTQAADLTYLGWSLRGLAGIMLAASLVYYIRTLSGRARLIADTEVRSRQFALDIDRANWLVEMSFEYEKIQKPLSPELIAAFSRGLFDTDSRSGSEAPSSLTDLLVNADGVEVSLSRRGVRKAMRAASSVVDDGGSH